nr:MAG TPA: hypothetical protein [Caudoviricetes sp.]
MMLAETLFRWHTLARTASSSRKVSVVTLLRRRLLQKRILLAGISSIRK